MKRELFFTCNICGQRGVFRTEHYDDPEISSCASCGSNVRFRWLVHRLSLELFGRSIPLPDLPARPEITGIGLTDPACIAEVLAQRFCYRNTFLHAEPRFDIRSDPSPLGALDFLIASEVFEHVEPPVNRAFRNAATLLKESGFMLLTVPWVWDGSDPLPELYDWKLECQGGESIIVNRRPDGKIERFRDLSFDNGPGRSLGRTREHFAELYKWSIIEGGESREAGDFRRLKNRRRDGTEEVFYNLAFHGGIGFALEMRLFTKRSLESSLREAGFAQVEFDFEYHEEFGIVFRLPWGRPIVARRGLGLSSEDR